ncbi:HPr family phosphocarrier protein [Bacillus suaedae]|uniref:HPr family phosphocarrier protein n=1 Tax=Halalkalibacter suaedae TaxID=2822140 RepID=A0A940WUP9_9BACI|nr:HPr family phosphocarrier protein [Bacillus suaedae]MBP3950987.1 HPr family phosphocarrier protein [Bacillus suaedae]
MKVKVLKPIFGETATKLVNTAGAFPETILIKKDHWVIDAKSLLGLLAISLQPDHEVILEVSDSEDTAPLDALLAIGIFEKI